MVIARTGEDTQYTMRMMYAAGCGDPLVEKSAALVSTALNDVVVTLVHNGTRFGVMVHRLYLGEIGLAVVLVIPTGYFTAPLDASLNEVV